MLLLAIVLLAPAAVLVHDEAAPMETLARGLRAAGISASVEDRESFRKSGPGARVVFMYVHGDLHSDIEAALIGHAEKGGRLIVLHHGMASGKMRRPSWPEFLGIRILPRDAPEYAWKVLRGDVDVVNLAPDHWVTTHRVAWPTTASYTPSDSPSVAQELASFRLPDTEFFNNQLVTDARRKTVLLGVKVSAGGRTIMQDRGGWMMRAGKGHVFYFQPGHFARDFENPTYLRILINAAQWTPSSTF